MRILWKSHVVKLSHRQTTNWTPSVYNVGFEKVWKGQDSMSLLYSKIGSKNGWYHCIQLSLLDRSPNIRLFLKESLQRHYCSLWWGTQYWWRLHLGIHPQSEQPNFDQCIKECKEYFIENWKHHRGKCRKIQKLVE